MNSVTVPLATSAEDGELPVRQVVYRMAAGRWGFNEADDTLGL